MADLSEDITAEPEREKRLSRHHQTVLKDLHRKVKGTYLQLSQLLDELDLLMRK